MVMEDVVPQFVQNFGPGSNNINRRDQQQLQQQQLNQQQQHPDEQQVRPAQYSIPGILHFIQHEWAKFEMERAQWEVERAELQARVAFLQGERKGQENLKRDLVRRIKMLEYALKQERVKFHKLKYGSDLIQTDMKPQLEENEDTYLHDAFASDNSNNMTWRQGRQLLRQYLQEIGYQDNIIDVRSQRVRALLGLAQTKKVENGSNVQVANLKNKKPSQVENALRDAEDSVLQTFDFLQSESGPIDATDEMNEDEELNRRLNRNMNDTVIAVENMLDDDETEDALKEFDFLEGGVESENKDQQTIEEWGMNQQKFNKLKEQYQKERKGERGQRVKRTTLQNMIAALERGGDEDQSSNTPPYNELDETAIRGDAFLQDTRTNNADDDLSLGELAELTVSNDAEPLGYDISPSKGACKTWSAKYSLRSHFDGIRAVAFHPTDSVLVTASEDHTLKLWNLQKTLPAKKVTSLDVEPVYTFRGHRKAVLSLAIDANGEQCFSGGLDGNICVWSIPDSNVDPYDVFDVGILATCLTEHSDAVWDLSMHAVRPHLLSCSADKSVMLWDVDPDNKDTKLQKYLSEIVDDVPTSVDFVRCETGQMVAGYKSAVAVIYDLETAKPLLTLENREDGAVATQVNRVLSHPTLPVTVAAYEDRSIKFFDNNSGKMVHTMVAHLDAVTSLAVDPNGLYLLSGSHDSSVRLWNMDSKTCVQEMTAHRKKFDEAIYDVAFHPAKPFIASAGADALAKVFA